MKTQVTEAVQKIILLRQSHLPQAAAAEKKALNLSLSDTADVLLALDQATQGSVPRE